MPSLEMLPWGFVMSCVFAAGLFVFARLLGLPGGPLLNDFSFVKHQVQAVADQFDYCEEYSH